MTAEIAILNRHAIALAADSAVTVGRQRAWKTANKLFSLSPVNDIGIMIYGSGDFCGCSWEIVAKTFRERVGNRVFSTVSECGNEFLEYLSTSILEDADSENVNVFALIHDIMVTVKHQVGAQTSKRSHSRRLRAVITDQIDYFKENHKRLNSPIGKQQFIEDYSSAITMFSDEVFDFSLTKGLVSSLYNLLYLAFDSDIESSLSTGLVVTGYGKDQLFPELIDYQVDGKHCGFVRVWVGRKEDFNGEDGNAATVVPFAQSDMFQLFMEGITHNHLTFIHNTLLRVLNDKSSRLVERLIDDENDREAEVESQMQDNSNILDKFFEEFSKYVHEEMVRPVVRVISTLPKEEMAAMAEALVEITTLRRKVDSTVESVGGPTDVAIISKGDGFVWIKRKYYFDIELNPDFLKRKRFNHGGGDAT